jgi:hypothetical protein
MKQYIIQFSFEGKTYSAHVTEIDGLDDVQYAVSPKDERIAERFRTNLFEKDKQDNSWHYDFPSAANGEAYMQAVVAGLMKQ